MPMGIALSCHTCGEMLLPADRFCIQCGEPASGRAPQRPSRPQDELLQRLERATRGVYDVAGELGRGGMAVVYLAHDIEADRKVAIKVLSPVLENDPDAVRRFRQDAQTAAKLEHPHIIPIYRVESRGSPVYFVMKFVDGGALDVILQRGGPLPVSVTRTVLGQVGRALDHAHRRGVVHRDVKPGNVLVDREGWVIVSDFGIAKVAQQRGLTMTGSFVGTPTYMSPEQCIARKELTGASDQYALGVVAYEMLTGRPPFVAESPGGLLLAHLQEPPPSLAEARADCPQVLADAIMRMLAKKPEDRWPSMRDAVAAIGGDSREPLGQDPDSARVLQLAQDTGERNVLAQMTAPSSPVPLGKTGAGSAPLLTALRVEPETAAMRVGGVVQLRAAVLDRTLQGDRPEPIRWTSSDTGVATVGPDGMVTARGPGTATILASSRSLSGSAAISVGPM
jgi:eukaryotic-like serine/threonine-protein kinase